MVAQSPKSLRLWKVDLSAFDAGEAGGSDSSEEEGAEDPAPEVDHPERKRKFEVYAKTLEGKTVKVRPFKRVLALRTSGLTMIPPPPLLFLFFNRSWTRASARWRYPRSPTRPCPPSSPARPPRLTCPTSRFWSASPRSSGPSTSVLQMAGTASCAARERHAGRGGNRRARGAGLACCRRSVHRGPRWRVRSLPS